MDRAVLFNTIGITGASMVVFGFYRINSGKWTNKSFWYELDNLIGAILVIIYQIHYHAFVTVFINLIWAVVALVGLSAFFRRVHLHRKKRRA